MAFVLLLACGPGAEDDVGGQPAEDGGAGGTINGTGGMGGEADGAGGEGGSECVCTAFSTGHPCNNACGFQGTATCNSDCLTFSECQVTDVCDGADNDCNDEPDDLSPCVQSSDSTCTTSCGTTGVSHCSSTCQPGSCQPPAEVCNGADEDCDGIQDNGLPIGGIVATSGPFISPKVASDGSTFVQVAFNPTFGLMSQGQHVIAADAVGFDIAWVGDRYVVAWTDGGSIRWRELGVTGAPMGSAVSASCSGGECDGPIEVAGGGGAIFLFTEATARRVTAPASSVSASFDAPVAVSTATGVLVFDGRDVYTFNGTLSLTATLPSGFVATDADSSGGTVIVAGSLSSQSAAAAIAISSAGTMVGQPFVHPGGTRPASVAITPTGVAMLAGEDLVLLDSALARRAQFDAFPGVNADGPDVTLLSGALRLAVSDGADLMVRQVGLLGCDEP